jgi:ADP-ribosylglycohydrolase
VSIEKIKGALFGLAVGDALGVPVEFMTRKELQSKPVITMVGYGVWNQPPGTWSDDSSLSFCLAEALTEDYDLNKIAMNFVAWLKQGYWGAHNKVFDIGNATNAAIGRIIKGTSPELAGGVMEQDNGNGSLMRILPLLFYIRDMSVEDRYKKIKEISSLTHAHFRSVLACFIYMEMALLILKGYSLHESYVNMQTEVKDFCSQKGFNNSEVALFDRVLTGDIRNHEKSAIHSGGYVINTIEASLWCLLNSNKFSDAVLKAVNLGNDSDTTACVTGGLAGLYYGYNAIPQLWIEILARTDDIKDLCERLYKKQYMK